VCFDRSEHLLDVPSLRALWAELRGLPEVDADAMCHQDLTPPNVLVENGRLAGLLDGAGSARPTRRSTWSRPGTCLDRIMRAAG